MPNWCYNIVTVTGPTNTIEKLTRDIRGENTTFSLNKIVPIADTEDWYQQRLNHWGTKWDVEADTPTSITTHHHTITTWQFSSAWSPPEPVFAALARKYNVHVAATCSEEGSAFWGGGTWNGNSGDTAETPGPHPCIVTHTPAGWIRTTPQSEVSIHSSEEEATDTYLAHLCAYQPTVLVADNNSVLTRNEPTVEMYKRHIEGADGHEFTLNLCHELADSYSGPNIALLDAVNESSDAHPERYAALRYYIGQVWDNDGFNDSSLTVEEAAEILTSLVNAGTDARTAARLLANVHDENLHLSRHLTSVLAKASPDETP